MGMEYRPYYMARELQRLGHGVTILTAAFSHLRRENFSLPPANEAAPYLPCTVQGVRFWVLPTPRYHGNGAGRLLNVAAFLAGLARCEQDVCEKLHPQAVIASSTHPFDSFFAARVAKRCSAALLFELHDIWPLSLVQLHGFTPGHPLMRTIWAAQRFAVEKSDAVVSLLPHADRYLAACGAPPKRYFYLPNGAECAPAKQRAPRQHLLAIARLRQRYGAVVAYAGGLERANAAEQLPALARLLPQVGFVLLGQGSAQQRQALRRNAPQNLLLLPAVEHTQVHELLRQADVLWLGMRQLSVYRYGIAMNKLFDYMAAGVPILLFGPCVDNPVSRAKCGITVSNGDMLTAAKALQRLLALGAAQRAALGRRGAAAVQKQYAYSRLAVQYQSLLEDLAGEGSKKIEKLQHRHPWPWSARSGGSHGTVAAGGAFSAAAGGAAAK